MVLTKKQLIDALLNLDVPDETVVVKASGIGFENIYDVNTQNIVSSSFKDNKEFLAIVLD
jgi:ribosomal protein RSM22 (predicted rRNA methylase)